MPPIISLNPIVSLLIGVSVGGIVGVWLNNFALWFVTGTALGLLAGQYSRNRDSNK